MEQTKEELEKSEQVTRINCQEIYCNNYKIKVYKMEGNG